MPNARPARAIVPGEIDLSCVWFPRYFYPKMGQELFRATGFCDSGGGFRMAANDQGHQLHSVVQQNFL